MADIKKFLDKAGVSTLWTKVAEELNKKATVEALNGVKSTADKAAEVEGGYEALIAKLVASGVKKSEAKKLAKEMIVANPDLLTKEE